MHGWRARTGSANASYLAVVLLLSAVARRRISLLRSRNVVLLWSDVLLLGSRTVVLLGRSLHVLLGRILHVLLGSGLHVLNLLLLLTSRSARWIQKVSSSKACGLNKR